MNVLLQHLQRRRVTLGFVLAVVVLVIATPTTTSLLLGAAIAAVGEAVRVWAAGHLEKSREITKSGPYRFTRHPLYVGSAVMAAGVVVAAHSTLATTLVIMYLVLTYGAAILGEEAYLRRTFGGEYDAYARGATDGKRSFSVDRVWRNREYRAILGLFTLVALLALKLAW